MRPTGTILVVVFSGTLKVTFFFFCYLTQNLVSLFTHCFINIIQTRAYFYKCTFTSENTKL